MTLLICHFIDFSDGLLIHFLFFYFYFLLLFLLLYSYFYFYFFYIYFFAYMYCIIFEIVVRKPTYYTMFTAVSRVIHVQVTISGMAKYLFNEMQMTYIGKAGTYYGGFYCIPFCLYYFLLTYLVCK